MTEHRVYGPRDEAPLVDGDAGFTGVDMLRNPRQLEPGLVSGAINKDFRNGAADKRKAFTTQEWAGERAISFPISFRQDHPFFELFSADESCDDNLNFRIYNGTTLQLRCAAPSEWFTVRCRTSGGSVAVVLDQDGVDDSDWVYAAYDEDNANFRLLDDKTLQLRNEDTGLWHTIYITLFDEAPILTVDQDGMTDDEDFGDALEYNFLIRDDTTLQILCPSTNEFYSIYVVVNGGYPNIAIDESGQAEERASFNIKQGFGEVFGSLTFSDPFGNEGSLLATRFCVYRIIANCEPQVIFLPGDVELTDEVLMIQCFDRVLMFRGDEETLVWIPEQDFEEGLGSFEYITQTEERGEDEDNTFGDGTDEVPDSDEALGYQNRVLVKSGRDGVVVSDIRDFSRYSSLTSRFRVNEGSDDEIKRLFPFDNTTVVVFKDQSIHLLGNFYGDLSDIRVDLLTAEYGCKAKNTVVNVGSDILFLSEAGLFSIGYALENRLRAGAWPLSAPIQPLIDRINWSYAANACADYQDNKLYLAVPIDGAIYNNAILIYDFINKSWFGYWNAEEILDVKFFFRLNSGGKRRLFIVNGDNLDLTKAAGAVLQVGSGLVDYLYDEEFEISDELLSRGYSCGSPDPKIFRKLDVEQGTWRPQFSVDLLTEGVNEVESLTTDETKDNAKYYIWGKADYDTSNINDDHSDPYREDYSVTMTGDDELTLGSGVNLDAMQTVKESYQLREHGAYCQVRIRNTQGRACQYAISIEAQAGERGFRRKV